MLGSVKRGLLGGALFVAVVFLIAAARAAYEMLTAPAPPPAVAPKAPVPARIEAVSPAGTTWTVPPAGDRLGMRLEFHADGSLLCTTSQGRVERGRWAAAGEGFSGELSVDEGQWTVRREVKGYTTADRLELWTRTTLDFRSGVPQPEAMWVDWSWGWAKEPAR